MLIHVVSAGDTLWKLAQNYHTTVNAINELNQLPNPNQLLIGQSLVIPSLYTSHRVRAGESLWSIAAKYGVTVDAIVQTNQITNPNLLELGMSLIIPPILHVVQPGETLMAISNLYGVSIQTIMNENHIDDSNNITIGMHLIIPRKKPEIEVNAYTYQSNEAAVETLDNIGHLLTYFSPFAYMIKEDGSLEPFDDQQMVEAAIAHNISPMLSITNFTSTEAGSNLSHVVLSNPELRETLINNVIQVMDEKGYTVLNVDFENVLPEDRENYNEFLQLCVERLHPKGYLVSTALAPKTSEQQGGLLYEAHDYEEHGRIADFVILMTYEWGYRKGPPQAISPINKMRQVVEYALTVIPAEKIFLGFQIYARDWVVPHIQGQEAETFSPQEAIRRAYQYGAPILYNVTAQSPYFRYVNEQGVSHEVWFEDARSAQAKFDMVKQYNLRGVSYWALGFPYPQNWVLLNDNFIIKKL